jgi:hypothetical protein
VTDVGPVRVFEEYVPVQELLSGQCPALGDVGEVQTTASLELLSTEVVAVAGVSWGDVKSLYRSSPRR